MSSDLPWEEQTSQMGCSLGSLYRLQAVGLGAHIVHHHNGNTSAFARTQGVRYDQVTRWLRRNCMVIDGKVYCEVSKKGLKDA